MSEDLDKTLRAIAVNAKALREAGVYGRVTIGDITFELDAPTAAVEVTRQPDKIESDPLNDPATYGADSVPQRKRPFSNDATRSEFEKDG